MDIENVEDSGSSQIRPDGTEVPGPAVPGVTIPAAEALGAPAEPADTVGESTPTAEPVRDEHGRFVSPADAVEPDPLTRFSPQLVDLARSVYLSDEEIGTFTSSTLLYDVVRGRVAGMTTTAPAVAPAGAAPQQQVQAAETDLAIEDFALDLDGEAGEEVAKPVRELVSHVNKVKSALVEEIHKLRRQNAELTAGVMQSASAAQRAAVQQQTTFWDDVASSVPGLVEAVGRPSQALTSQDGPQGRAWSDLAPLISARAQSQSVPEHLIDFARATREAWAAYQVIDKNGKGLDTRGAPGVAARPAPRRSAAPALKPNMTTEEDYNARLGALENAFAQAGGNPFALEGGSRVI